MSRHTPGFSQIEEAIKIVGRTLWAISPRYLQAVTVAVWLAFLAAFLASDFFVVAHNAGLYAALEAGALLGPLRSVSHSTCTYPFYGCSEANDYTTYEPSFSVSLKLLFMVAIVMSVGLSFWASERNRKS